MRGLCPSQYEVIEQEKNLGTIDRYFAMAGQTYPDIGINIFPQVTVTLQTQPERDNPDFFKLIAGISFQIRA